MWVFGYRPLWAVFLPRAFLAGQVDGTAGEQSRRSLHRDDRTAACPDSDALWPNELTLDMLGYYQQAADLMKPIGRVPLALTISPRLAVQLKLDDGMVVELGASSRRRRCASVCCASSTSIRTC